MGVDPMNPPNLHPPPPETVSQVCSWFGKPVLTDVRPSTRSGRTESKYSPLSVLIRSPSPARDRVPLAGATTHSPPWVPLHLCGENYYISVIIAYLINFYDDLTISRINFVLEFLIISAYLNSMLMARCLQFRLYALSKMKVEPFKPDLSDPAFVYLGECKIVSNQVKRKDDV